MNSIFRGPARAEKWPFLKNIFIAHDHLLPKIWGQQYYCWRVDSASYSRPPPECPCPINVLSAWNKVLKKLTTNEYYSIFSHLQSRFFDLTLLLTKMWTKSVYIITQNESFYCEHQLMICHSLCKQDLESFFQAKISTVCWSFHLFSLLSRARNDGHDRKQCVLSKVGVLIKRISLALLHIELSHSWRYISFDALLAE